MAKKIKKGSGVTALDWVEYDLSEPADQEALRQHMRERFGKAKNVFEREIRGIDEWIAVLLESKEGGDDAPGDFGWKLEEFLREAREAIEKGYPAGAAQWAYWLGRYAERARIKFEREPAHKSETARRAVNARHSKPGGAKERHQKIRAAWKSGKYTSKDICAEQEYQALGFGSFSAARDALKDKKK